MSGTSGGIVGMPGGQVDASTYGPTCRGWIAAAPDHTMVLSAPMNISINVTATPMADTAMVISGPGGVQCNDDFNGLNPGLSGLLAAGTYSIWVASYAMNTNHPYTITFQDLSAPPPPVPTTPTTVPGLMTMSTTPTDPLGAVTLAAGFMPDPQTRTGTVMGTVDVSAVPNLYGGTCRGWVQPNPGHVMNLTTAFTYLRVHVTSTTDTTLIIQDPNGGFWCNDDADMLNPLIEGPWNPGLWRIWVGVYSVSTGSVTPVSYQMVFTEFAR
jgi:hypothetical protein